MPATLEGVAGLGREDLDAAPVQDQFHVVGEGPQQPPVLAGGVEPPGFPRELVMEADQVGRHGPQDQPSESVPQPLVLLVQPVDNRFPVRGTPVRVGQVPLYQVQAPGKLAERPTITRVPSWHWRHVSSGFFPVAGRAGLLVARGRVQITVGQGESPPSRRNAAIWVHDTLASFARTQSDGNSGSARDSAVPCAAAGQVGWPFQPGWRLLPITGSSGRIVRRARQPCQTPRL
jgi:hypothetical protein